ncbi:MAG: glycosyltransferase [Gemmatimonadales bacterium]
MRLLILGAGDRHRTEAALARAARQLGHAPTVIDALGHRRRLGPLAPRLIRWLVDRAEPEMILCTRHAISTGEPMLAELFRGRRTAFWYFDATTPLPPRVLRLAGAVSEVYATCGFQVTAFARAGHAARLLPQGLDAERDRPAPVIPAAYRCDLSFIGSGQFARRHEILHRFSGAGRLQIRGPSWEGAPAALPVAGGTVRGSAVAQVIGGAGLSLGVNALPPEETERDGGTSNRLWRVLGAGGCFLGEHVPGVEGFAAPGQHALWYREVDEGVAFARQYLADPPACQRIAAAGRAHALAHHTYAHRLALLLAGQGYTST